MDNWILTSEKLPEDYQTVIVTYIVINFDSGSPKEIREPQVSIACYCGDWYWWYPGIEEDLYDDYDKADFHHIAPFIMILSWMPMPEPMGKAKFPNDNDVEQIVQSCLKHQIITTCQNEPKIEVISFDDASGWISTREAMPKDDMDVLVCDNTGEVNVASHSSTDDYWIVAHLKSYNLFNFQVKWWRPLPPIPEQIHDFS